MRRSDVNFPQGEAGRWGRPFTRPVRVPIRCFGKRALLPAFRRPLPGRGVPVCSCGQTGPPDFLSFEARAPPGRCAKPFPVRRFLSWCRFAPWEFISQPSSLSSGFSRPLSGFNCCFRRLIQRTPWGFRRYLHVSGFRSFPGFMTFARLPSGTHRDKLPPTGPS